MRKKFTHLYKGAKGKKQQKPMVVRTQLHLLMWIFFTRITTKNTKVDTTNKTVAIHF